MRLNRAFCWIAAFVVGLSGPVAAQDRIELRPALAATLVAPDGALTFYELEADLAPGTQQLRLWLPGQGALLGSLTLEGDAALISSAVSTMTTTLPEALWSDQEREAEAALVEAQLGLSAIVDQVALAEAEQLAQAARFEVLQQHLQFEAETSEELGGMIAVLSETLTDAARGQAALASELRELEERHAEQEVEVTQAQAALDRIGLAAFGVVADVTLQVAEDGPVSLHMQRYSDAAFWTAKHQIEVTSQGANTSVMSLSTQALITNNTGLSWHDAELTLVTQPFAQRVAPSDLRVFPAQLRDLEALSRSRTASSQELDLGRRDELSFGDGVIEAPIMEPTSTRTQRSHLGTAEQRYVLAERVSVPANGQAAVVPLIEREMDAELFVRAQPRHETFAHRMMRVTNDDAPILPGRAMIQLDGEVVGEATIPFIASGAEHIFGLGQDRSIALEFHKREVGQGDVGIFGRDTQRREHLDYVLRNLGEMPREVEVLIALPYAEQDELDIDLRLQPTPVAERFEERRGVGQWRITLAPTSAETITVQAGFRWPEGHELFWAP